MAVDSRQRESAGTRARAASRSANRCGDRVVFTISRCTTARGARVAVALCEMMRPVRSRLLAATALMLLVALSAGACARRYAAGLVGGAPAHDVDNLPALSATTPPPAVKSDGRFAAAPKPASTPARPRPAPRDQSAGTIGTTGVDAVVPDTPTTGSGSPVVTVTTTPGTDPEPAPLSPTTATGTLR